MRRSLMIGIAAVALAGSAATTAASATPPSGAPLPSPTLRLAELDAPTLDPALASSPDAVMIQNALCARLYTPTGQPATVIPQIATAMPSAAPDRQRPRQWTTYTIHLRSGYRFQDGSPVTAYSFAEAFARDSDPDEQSPAFTELNTVVGAAAVEQTQASALSGVVAVNALTLEISTLKPDPSLAVMLAEPYFCPVEEDTPVAPTGLTLPPSDGPYFVAKNVPGEIVFERNHYYDGSRPAYAAITLDTGVSFMACQRDVAQRTVDICLDALPQHALTEPLSALTAQGWIARNVGCLSWRPIVRIDLPALCPQRA